MTAIKVQKQNAINLWDNKENLQQIKSLFAPKLNDLEFQFFIGLGKATQLNPFTREIWCVKYQDNTPAQVFIGRDGYRKAAQAHNDYDYHQVDAVYENDHFEIIRGEVTHSYKLSNRGRLMGAYCIVKRKSKSKPIYVFTELSEYSTGKSLWKSVEQGGKPATMIKKCAEAQCLRMAFQDILGGTYCPEEMERGIPGKTNVIQIEEVQTQTEKLKNIIDVNQATGEIINESITEEQKNTINYLIFDKDLTEERIEKALNYYKVDSFENLNSKQAALLISQLERI